MRLLCRPRCGARGKPRPRMSEAFTKLRQRFGHVHKAWSRPVASDRSSESAWSSGGAKAPRPSNAKGRYNFELTDVACVALRNCAATGYLFTNTVLRGLLFVEKDGRWRVSERPLPGILRQGNKSEGVSSVSCPAAGHCVAVGYAASGPQLEPLVFTQRTRGWRETVPALPAGVKGGRLDLVSCPSIGNCTADLPPNGSVTTSGQTSAIEGLSCWAPGDCAAVGLYGDM